MHRDFHVRRAITISVDAKNNEIPLLMLKYDSAEARRCGESL